MKTYLATTGTIFGLFAILRVFRIVAEWNYLVRQTRYFARIAAISVAAGAMAIWAWTLFREIVRAGKSPKYLVSSPTSQGVREEAPVRWVTPPPLPKWASRVAGSSTWAKAISSIAPMRATPAKVGERCYGDGS